MAASGHHNRERNPDRRSTSFDILRSELENLEEEETFVPVRPSPRTGAQEGHGLHDTDQTGPARLGSMSPRVSVGVRRSESGHVAFSDGEHTSRGTSQHLHHGGTNLYPIESRVDDTETAQEWRESRKQHAQTQPGQDSAIEGTNARLSRVSFAAPPSITRPRHRRMRFDGIEDSIRRAAQGNTKIANAKDWVVRQRARTKRQKRARFQRLKAKATELYQQWILEGLLRQKPLPPSVDGRHIPLAPGLSRRKDGLTDERRGTPYTSNFIRSSRYTIWSFLPKQLFFQFSKLANAYFLTIGILQMIPGLSTTGKYTTILPLFAFVAISMAKEGYDDYRRYKMDKLENRTDSWVLDPEGRLSHSIRQTRLAEKFRKPKAQCNQEGELQNLSGVVERDGERPPWSQDEDVRWSRTQWQNIRVGDIIKLRRDDNVPADVVLLYATGPNGIAYIETMALDGETNLKSKQACSILAEHCHSLSALEACEAEIVSEDPNLDLYDYEGKAIVNGRAVPLTLNQVVYRGSTLRNTTEAIGVVVNSGEECKIRMNASKNVHAKSPKMQADANKIIILLVFFVVILSVGCSIGNIIWVEHTEHIAWYLNRYVVSFGHILIGFVIAFNTLIPLSLYVSLEIVKIGQVMLLRDVDMYDPVSNTPMNANTTTILEDLGQVSYVFSDKTGTLTENLMKFRKMSVAGVSWLHDLDLRRDADSRGGMGVSTSYETGKGKGKQIDRYSTSSTISYNLGSAPAEGRSAGRRSSSSWITTTHPEDTREMRRTDELVRCIRQRPNSPFAQKARQFILCVALCHTCLPEKKPDGKIEFQASSPDELALVEAAQDLGVLLVDRPTQNIKLQFSDETGVTSVEEYEVLDVIEFSSHRKRMSIIIRMPSGKICVFTKGADSVILPRLKLSRLAMETASSVDKQASIRKSMEQHAVLHRISLHSGRTSTGVGRSSTNTHMAGAFGRKSGVRRSSSMGRKSCATDNYPTTGAMLDEPEALSDGALFERCFQHMDDFASEGLRTLLYAFREVSETEYAQWKIVYQDASTSLTSRQEGIEAAAEMIEQNFDLAGVTAIEDKLQQGVPETIEKLRRASIKVWMLTGDKRETAINIAHSAHICKPFSEVYILDATTEGSLHEKIAATLVDVGRGMVPHSVVVIDGHTLSVVEDDEALKILFFDLVARVDSVICCRAAPAQKATLVKCIRQQVPSSITLAIGDGANDIAMIQASHVGIGISGREGLQAARISDYSIAQFRFLQKLLFVHGRWNYHRTGKYILSTFWKEIAFYMMQALYQRYNGYTGTSLYESASLAVFNTLFTSLSVILPGIFEQDLRAETLLAVPELYVYGQKNQAFNFRKYVGWTLMGVIEALLMYFGIWGIFTHLTFDLDNGLFAMGTLAFTAAVVFINIKLLVLEVHHKTLVTTIGFLLSVGGWFLWNFILGAVYRPRIGPYIVHGAFVHHYGKTAIWWLTLVMVLIMATVLELTVTALRRIYWPQDEDLMQELEKRLGVADVFGVEDAELEEAYTDEHETGPEGSKHRLERMFPETLGERWGAKESGKKGNAEVHVTPVAGPSE